MISRTLFSSFITTNNTTHNSQNINDDSAQKSDDSILGLDDDQTNKQISSNLQQQSTVDHTATKFVNDTSTTVAGNNRNVSASHPLNRSVQSTSSISSKKSMDIEKLIGEYEQNIARQEKAIHSLQDTLSKLKLSKSLDVSAISESSTINSNLKAKHLNASDTAEGHESANIGESQLQTTSIVEDVSNSLRQSTTERKDGSFQPEPSAHENVDPSISNNKHTEDAEALQKPSETTNGQSGSSHFDILLTSPLRKKTGSPQTENITMTTHRGSMENNNSIAPTMDPAMVEAMLQLQPQLANSLSGFPPNVQQQILFHAIVASTDPNVIQQYIESSLGSTVTGSTTSLGSYYSSSVTGTTATGSSGSIGSKNDVRHSLIRIFASNRIKLASPSGSNTDPSLSDTPSTQAYNISDDQEKDDSEATIAADDSTAAANQAVLSKRGQSVSFDNGNQPPTDIGDMNNSGTMRSPLDISSSSINASSLHIHRSEPLNTSSRTRVQQFLDGSTEIFSSTFYDDSGTDIKLDNSKIDDIINEISDSTVSTTNNNNNNSQSGRSIDVHTQNANNEKQNTIGSSEGSSLSITTPSGSGVSVNTSELFSSNNNTTVDSLRKETAQQQHYKSHSYEQLHTPFFTERHQTLIREINDRLSQHHNQLTMLRSHCNGDPVQQLLEDFLLIVAESSRNIENMAYERESMLQTIDEKDCMIRAYQQRLETESRSNESRTAYHQQQQHQQQLLVEMRAMQERIHYLEGQLHTANQQQSYSKQQSDKTQKETNTNSSVVLENWKAKCRQHEAVVKQKEDEIRALQRKLESMITEEEKRNARNESLFEQLVQRNGPSRRAHMSTTDSRFLDIISVYESQRSLNLDEIKRLSEQVESLTEEVKLKENFIRDHIREQASSKELLQQLQSMTSDVEELKRLTKQKERDFEVSMQQLKSELAAAKQTITNLETENSQLSHDLSNRPTVKKWRETLQQLEELQSKLANEPLLTEQIVNHTNNPQRNINDFGFKSAFVDESNGTKRTLRTERKTSVGTTQNMTSTANQHNLEERASLNTSTESSDSNNENESRDREEPLYTANESVRERVTGPIRIARNVNDLNLVAARHVLKGVCAFLKITDVTKIQPALTKVEAVVRAVPRMEKFITEVCSAMNTVQREQHQHQNTRTRSLNSPIIITPENAIFTLYQWASHLRELNDYLEFESLILQELTKRSTTSSSANTPIGYGVRNVSGGGGGSQLRGQMTKAYIISSISELVESERSFSESSEAFVSAAALLQSDPNTLIHRIVLHFQKLFDVPKLEGVLPKMNQLYLLVNESINATRALRSLLALDAHSSIHECLQRVKLVLEKRFQAPTH